eukprot:IDg14275t1
MPTANRSSPSRLNSWPSLSNSVIQRGLTVKFMRITTELSTRPHLRFAPHLPTPFYAASGLSLSCPSGLSELHMLALTKERYSAGSPATVYLNELHPVHFLVSNQFALTCKLCCRDYSYLLCLIDFVTAWLPLQTPFSWPSFLITVPRKFRIFSSPHHETLSLRCVPWFGMFWDCFRARTNGSYNEQIGSVLGPSRLPSNVNDRNNMLSFNRQGGQTQVTQGLHYGPNGFSQARPPHHPGPQTNPMAQSPATMSRSRAAAASSSRATRPPYGSMGSPGVQGFGLDIDNGIQGAGMLHDTIGQLMAGSPSNQRAGVPGVDVQGTAMASMGNQLRQSAQQGRPGSSTPESSHNPAFMSSLSDMPKNRMSNPDAFVTSNRRSSAETAPHLRLGNTQDDDPLALRRAPPAMHGSKKRPNSASVSLEALQTGAEFMGMSQSQPSPIQAQNQSRMHPHQAQQQKQQQQLPCASNRQTVHQLQHRQHIHETRIREASLDGFPENQQAVQQGQQAAQQSQQERPRGMRSEAHQRPQSHHSAFDNYSHQTQQAQQQKLALSGQQGRPGQAQNRNKFSPLAPNMQTPTQRQTANKHAHQHRNLTQNANSGNVQRKVDAQDGSTPINIDTYKTHIGRTGQPNVSTDANVRGSCQMPQENLSGAGEQFLMMRPMQNGNQALTPSSRQSTTARQRQGYTGRPKISAIGNRPTNMVEVTAQSRAMQVPDSMGTSANAAKDSRRGGAQPVLFHTP